jgi:DNA-binding NarL/FixJ family response regulator
MAFSDAAGLVAAGSARERTTQLQRRGRRMAPQVTLTAREADVLRLLARGCTYTQVGERLELSVNTVATHVKNIYRKLEVRSARAAVWRAFNLRLLGDAES